MSRIGKNPIPVPATVTVDIGNGVVQVKGPKGTLLQNLPDGITASMQGEQLIVERANDEKQQRSLHGLIRSLLANAVTGVADGFKKELDIVGVGYKADLRGPQEIVLSVGYSHQVTYKAPEDVTLSHDPKANRISVEGIDKQKVGQVAAELRAIRPPDAYKGKGIRYTGERLKLKAGKAGA